MHTFFINTSAKDFTDGIDILDIQREIRKYSSFRCCLSAWYETGKGYESCALKISELINSYKDVKNDYNLIIYVDLLEFAEIAARLTANTGAFPGEGPVYTLMQQIIIHLLHETICAKLDELGCVPGEILVIFEQNATIRITGDGIKLADIKADHVLSLLGLPTEDALRQAFRKDPGTFNPEAAQSGGHPFIPGIDKLYAEQIRCLYDSVKSGSSIDRCTDQLLRHVEGIYTRENHTLQVSHWITNRRVLRENVQMNVKHTLQLQLFLLECTDSETTLQNKADARRGKAPIPKTVQDPGENWSKIIAGLLNKQSIYQKRYQETASLSDRFLSIKLAPELLVFDHALFGMDEYGAKAVELSLVDGENTASKPENEGKEQGILSGKRKAIVATRKKRNNLFTETKYKPFDYDGTQGESKRIRADAPTEYYVEQAHKVRLHHIDYLKKMKDHVSNVLSNYAGRSLENDPALLSQRRVSVAEEYQEDTAIEYRYAQAGQPADTRKLDTVKGVAAAAYETALLSYLEFCAGRSVAVTDIEEQCNWFVNRIHEIKQSLKKLHMVAIGLLAAIVALYLPFFIIQWESIVESAVTLSIALGCVAVPIVILCAVYTVLSALQRRKCLKAWNDFKMQSDKILEENTLAAQKYDELLSSYIPTLRWVYEYKLDTEFCEECCKMAKAKIAHHMQKLRERSIAVGNILEDLECNPSDRAKYRSIAADTPYDTPDYNLAFCSGENNQQFYSMIDSHTLGTIHH